MNTFEKQFKLASKLYATVDEIDYYLYDEGEGFFFWAEIKGRRIMTPMYMWPPGVEPTLTSKQVWEGGYDSGFVEAHPVGTEGERIKILEPSLIDLFANEINNHVD